MSANPRSAKLAQVMAIVNRTPDSFYDKGATFAEAEALRRCAEVIEQGGTSVVCAQGDVIPGMIAWLSAQGTLPIDTEIHAKKGSVWVLSFHGGQLTGADYVPSALPVL